MEEEITITEVVKQGSQAPEWATAGTTLTVRRRYDSSEYGERLVVSPQDAFGQAKCHRDSDGRLAFGGTATYVPHIVEAE